MPSKTSILPKKSPSPNLYFLHGFLGDPADWNEVMAHLPGYTCTALRYPFQLPQEGVLIGYSMGGRIALNSPLPKILISTHPGLTTATEKQERLRQDQQWIEKLKTQPLSQFLDEWYEQQLFQPLKTHPHFHQILNRRLRQDSHVLIDQLKRHSLAHQPFITDLNAAFIHGALDHKYRNLYQKLQIPSLEIPGIGHACHLERPAEVAQTIMKILRDL